MRSLFSRMLVSILLIGVTSADLRPVPGCPTGDEESVKDAYREYVRAWKTKDLAALQRLLADDYMALNGEGEVSTKENEIATAKTDLLWDAMTVDEIHARVFRKRRDHFRSHFRGGKTGEGKTVDAKVRFLAALVKRNGNWQLVATQSAPLRQTPQKHN